MSKSIEFEKLSAGKAAVFDSSIIINNEYANE
jgi:hypothetical protein